MMVKKLFLVDIQRLLFAIGFLVALIIVSQCFYFPYGKTLYISLPNNTTTTLAIANAHSSNNSESTQIYAEGLSDLDAFDSEYETEDKNEPDIEDDEEELESNSMSENGATIGIMFQTKADISRDNATEFGVSPLKQGKRVYENNENYIDPVTTTNESSSEISSQAGTTLGLSEGSFFESTINSSVLSMEEQFKQAQPKEVKISVSSSFTNISTIPVMYDPKRRLHKPIVTLSKMSSLLLQSTISSRSTKPRRSSPRDRDLVFAKQEIENAPIIRSSEELSALVFRNVSKFIRSYELMESVLKVYIYKEGERPIFHQPYMRGIYASEGWFMKLIEANKKFVVRDPKKAHLFYLPFSSKVLRFTLNSKESMEKRNLEKYLKKYVDLIARKYRYWNRTEGADHFLVACHDWASYLTRKTMKNCIRSLCNANAAKDFRIGKDTSFPVTYVRSSAEPLENIGGKPVSKRSILAFFAGGLHGYLRPILLQYWANKEPDMKIFGPMPRDIEGKRAYREYMKSSKYCICARGYEVHTPRVVESIFYECVPVIISDNYVPPFFEVLDWEAFSVFVQERDVPNLRNILLSIPKKKYEALQLGVKMVQKHFFWYKKPERYDLFHMALHSVWHNRLLQVH